MASITKYIATSGADGYWDTNSSGTIFRNNTANVRVGKSETETWGAWFNFQTRDIDQGATVLSARITLICSTKNIRNTCNVIFYCNDADNATSPANRTQAEALALTSESDPETLTGWLLGEEHAFDITSSVQEVVNRAGFNAGNNIMVVVKDGGSTIRAQRYAYSYDGDPSYVAKLELQYINQGSSEVVPDTGSLRKKYYYKLYDINRSFIGTLNTTLVTSTPSFTWAINGGMGSLSIDLAMNLADAEYLNYFTGKVEGGLIATRWDDVYNWNSSYWDYAPGTVTKVHSIDIYTVDKIQNEGHKIWSGLLKKTELYANENGSQGVRWHCYSWITEASKLLYENASGQTTITHNSTDPSEMFRDVIDRLNAKNDIFTYDDDSILNTGLTISYTFKYVTCLEALDKILELCPDNWFYYIDANNKVYLKQAVSEYVDHKFFLGVQCSAFTSEVDESNIVNKVYFKGGDTGGGSDLYYKYQRAGSVSVYSAQEIQVTDSRVTQAATAETKAERILNEREAPVRSLKITVPDDNSNLGEERGYDLELLNPGDIITLNYASITSELTNWDSAEWDEAYWDAGADQIFGVPFNIVSLQYTPTKAIIDVKERLPTFEKRQEDIDRNLKDEQSINIPTTPS